MEGSENITVTTEGRATANRAEELNRELFSFENKAAALNAELFSAKKQPVDLSGYVNKESGGCFDSDELKRPSPARRAGVTVVACLLAAVMGFFGAVVGIVLGKKKK